MFLRASFTTKIKTVGFSEVNFYSASKQTYNVLSSNLFPVNSINLTGEKILLSLLLLLWLLL
jgi:hypothetical protein